MNDYPLPLYLNQKYVFDVLAMMENGFSHISNLKSRSSSEDGNARSLSVDVGGSNLFSFLGVTLGGGRNTTTANAETVEVSTEKVHTPNSLFERVRRHLLEQSLVSTGPAGEMKLGDFAEIRCRLQPNPLVRTLEGMRSILESALAFVEPKAKPKDHPESKASLEKQVQQIDHLLKSFSDARTVDLVGSVKDQEVRVVLSLDRNYLLDPSLGDLLEADLAVFGKVTAVLASESDRPVNLLRKTPLGLLAAERVAELSKPLSDESTTDFDLPEMSTTVVAPAIQLLPIAVFA
ncbi:MAG: hypothetical protein AAGD32_08365 [Planctomycetota bacterium]